MCFTLIIINSRTKKKNTKKPKSSRPELPLTLWRRVIRPLHSRPGRGRPQPSNALTRRARLARGGPGGGSYRREAGEQGCALVLQGPVLVNRHTEQLSLQLAVPVAARPVRELISAPLGGGMGRSV